jgi:hypothetical protein
VKAQTAKLEKSRGRQSADDVATAAYADDKRS